MVAFIGNTLKGKISGENFDESIATRQNSSDFSAIKVLCNTVYIYTNNTYIQIYKYIQTTTSEVHRGLDYFTSTAC